MAFGIYNKKFCEGKILISIEDVESLEALYAHGQPVKAIHECRVLAIKALPGHVDRLNSYLANQTHRFEGEVAHAEEYVFNIGKPENVNAAEVVVWCAKWTIGNPETHTTGFFKGQVRQTHVVRTREDFAHNAFIALRRMCKSAVAKPLSIKKATSKEIRETNRLERFYELGGKVKVAHGEPMFLGVKALNLEVWNSDQSGKDPKTIREDLKAAYRREKRRAASGQMFGELTKRTPT